MTARILAPTDESIALAAAHLRAGEPVAMPTETVYGLAAVATDAAAVARVFAAKERPTFDPLIVHVAPPAAAGAGEVPGGPAGTLVAWLAAQGVVDAAAVGAARRKLVEALGRAFWPGPLTLVLPRGPAIPDLVTAGLATVAVRAPRHSVARALIARVGAPLAAPSANRFGRISPTSAADVLAELGGRIELILDGGPCEIGLESTVLALGEEGPPCLLRPGAVSREAIAAIAGEVALPVAGGTAPAAPGMLASHYAPRTPLTLLDGPWGAHAAAALSSLAAGGGAAAAGPVGLLLQEGDPAAAARALERASGRPVIAVSLSPSGDRDEAARRLFGCLRSLDESAAVALLAEPCLDERGLGHAIADRLRRAAASPATSPAGRR